MTWFFTKWNFRAYYGLVYMKKENIYQKVIILLIRMYIYIVIKYKVILTSFNLSRFLNTLNHCFSDGIPAILNQDFESLFASSNHGVIIINRSNNSVLLYWKIYWNRQVFDLIRASGISMKPETLRHQASSSNF